MRDETGKDARESILMVHFMVTIWDAINNQVSINSTRTAEEEFLRNRIVSFFRFFFSSSSPPFLLEMSSLGVALFFIVLRKDDVGEMVHGLEEGNIEKRCSSNEKELIEFSIGFPEN